MVQFSFLEERTQLQLSARADIIAVTRRRPMSLMLDLPPELESELAAEAARLGLALPDYILRLLAGGRTAISAPRTGAELLAFWQGEGLVSTRPEIADSQAHARTLRDEAQRRARQ
jgi:hypothetical protein